jgi:DNA-binding IclR family transcriptional regulator
MAGRYRVALQETFKRGFALSVDESVKGLTSIAAPILGHDGVARAAISLVGPTSKMLADIQNPARLVQIAAKKLAQELCL